MTAILRSNRRAFCAVIVLLALLQVSVAQQPQHTVILISIDGMRADYIDRYPSPNMNSIAQRGVRAEAMIPSFPTKTFPNHYTIVTGLYPEHHGIIANTMYDPKFNATFKLNKREEVTNARWWGGEPIWVTAEKQGVRAATMFWPGSEAAIEGVRPTYWAQYDEKMPENARVDQVLAWLDLPADKRPALVTLYFEAVDTAGHKFGPESEEVKTAMATVDAAIGKLLDGLRQRNLEGSTDVIVVSDHGMEPVSKDRVILLDHYVDMKSVQVTDWSPVLAISAKDGDQKALVSKLKKVPHLATYRREKTPSRWHYRSNDRITPVVGLADCGWTITSTDHLKDDRYFGAGNHGFDNRCPTMNATFIAAGPSFAEGSHLKKFPNIDVYDMLAKLLKVTPATNDGKADVFKTVLKPSAKAASASR
jgi:predicted AlkP superfamily pyrophosphatase or phosphodiesterase